MPKRQRKTDASKTNKNFIINHKKKKNIKKQNSIYEKKKENQKRKINSTFADRSFRLANRTL